MAEQQTLIDAAELTHLVLECLNCGTSTTRPMSADVGTLAKYGLLCPGCGNDWTETAKLHTYFRNFATKADDLGSGIRVRFKLTQQQSSE
jgi:hypothetical protein